MTEGRAFLPERRSNGMAGGLVKIAVGDYELEWYKGFCNTAEQIAAHKIKRELKSLNGHAVGEIIFSRDESMKATTAMVIWSKNVYLNKQCTEDIL